MVYLIKFLTIGVLGLTLISCTAQKYDGDYLKKYKEAVAEYEAENYYKSLQLFKETIPLLKGKKEIITAQFYQAYAYFYEKSYQTSARCFEEFYKTYPRLEQAEEALYMQGYSHYLDTPDVQLDQRETEKALKTLQLYLAKYPAGVYQKQASQYNEVLQTKLALKDFKNAKLYCELGHYQAAVVALENFQKQYPHATYNEEAIYLKVEAQYKFAENSQHPDQLNNFMRVVKYYYEFLDNYPDSKYGKNIEKIHNLALEKIDKFTNYKNT